MSGNTNFFLNIAWTPGMNFDSFHGSVPNHWPEVEAFESVFNYNEDLRDNDTESLVSSYMKIERAFITKEINILFTPESSIIQVSSLMLFRYSDDMTLNVGVFKAPNDLLALRGNMHLQPGYGSEYTNELIMERDFILFYDRESRKQVAFEDRRVNQVLVAYKTLDHFQDGEEDGS